MFTLIMLVCFNYLLFDLFYRVESPKRAAKFASNEQYSRLFMNISGKAKMDQQLSILTGIASGLTEAFIIVSFDLVKIRMQDKSSAYKNTLDCMARIMRVSRICIALYICTVPVQNNH